VPRRSRSNDGTTAEKPLDRRVDIIQAKTNHIPHAIVWSIMADTTRPTVTPEGWPDCESGQVRVLLLGTFHMDHLWSYESDTENDDMLVADRQAELRDLTDHLEDWNPDRIAVERPYGEVEAVNDSYEKYRSGEYAYDCEERFPSPDPTRNDSRSECRSEVVQVGFRLTDRLGHDRVVPVDEHPEEHDTDPFDDRTVDSTRKTLVTVTDPETDADEENERFASLSLAEYFEYMNENELRDDPDVMFDRAIRATGEHIGDEFVGTPVGLAYWYDRNLRVVHHLWRTMDASDDRILLLAGLGRIRMLRHLLDQAPMFCPVSPLPCFR
jgi:hypothetical protein